MSARAVELLGVLCLLFAPARAASAESYFVIAGGIGGSPAYSRTFDARVAALRKATLRTAGAPERVVALPGTTRAELRRALEDLGRRLRSDDTLVLLLIGHGSYDGERYKLNLRGPDMTAEQLAELLDGLPTRRQLVVNTTSASGASLAVLASEQRVVVTATRSGNERIAPRFGEMFTKALSDPSADTDKDGWISAREAFAYTERQVADAFERESLLQTEHAKLAGDGADGFLLARSRRAERTRAGAAWGGPRVADDARRSGDARETALLAERKEVSRKIEALRRRRAELDEEAYFAELEPLMLELSRIDLELDTRRGASGEPGP